MSRKKPLQFGRRMAIDSRDFAYPIRALLRSGKSSRTQRYWNDVRWFGDQRDTPACVGYAWAHWIEDGPVKPKGKPPVVKPLDLYRAAQDVDEWEGNTYEGTSVRGGAKALQSMGRISAYHWATGIEDVIQAVLEVGPVVVGSEWWAGMMAVDSNGFIQAEGVPLGGHAYLVNGVNVRKGFFRLKNSWGRSWGDAGRAKIAFADFERLLGDGGEACLATEVAA